MYLPNKNLHQLIPGPTAGPRLVLQLRHRAFQEARLGPRREEILRPHRGAEERFERFRLEEDGNWRV